MSDVERCGCEESVALRALLAEVRDYVCYRPVQDRIDAAIAPEVPRVGDPLTDVGSHIVRAAAALLHASYADTAPDEETSDRMRELAVKARGEHDRLKAELTEALKDRDDARATATTLFGSLRVSVADHEPRIDDLTAKVALMAEGVSGLEARIAEALALARENAALALRAERERDEALTSVATTREMSALAIDDSVAGKIAERAAATEARLKRERDEARVEVERLRDILGVAAAHLESANQIIADDCPGVDEEDISDEREFIEELRAAANGTALQPAPVQAADPLSSAGVLDPLSSAREPVQVAVNQCDGCRRGLSVDANGNHRGSSAWDLQGCTRDRYVPVDDDPSADHIGSSDK